MIIGHSLADENGVILAIDEKVADFLHHSQRNIVGRSYLELTHAADQRRNAERVARLRADSGPALIRKRYVRGDGASVWVDLHVSRLGSQLVGGFDVGEFDEQSRLYRLWSTARRLADVQQRRDERLGGGLFTDHAWTILVQIYLAEAEGRPIERKMLAQVMRISHIIVDRWLAVLEGRGLLEPCSDPRGGRQLSRTGFDELEHVLATFATGRADPALSRIGR